MIDGLIVFLLFSLIIVIGYTYVVAIMETFDLLSKLSSGRTCTEVKYPVLRLFNFFKRKGLHNGVALLGVIFCLLFAPITAAIYFGIPFFKWCIRK